MKIKQIGQYTGDIVETVLRNRNVKDIELFLNPNKEGSLNPFDLHNMKHGAEILLAHLSIKNKIGILVDPDADGFTSSTTMYQYIKLIYPDTEIQYFLHDSKAHGLTEKIVDKIVESDIDILIIPDAGSNDTEATSKIFFMGIDILIIDHHNIDKKLDVGILINNHKEENTNTNDNLVGVGMVYKFCQCLDEMLNEHYSDQFRDLVAVGQIGDGSDISENEIRYLVFQGLENIRNPFMKVVVDDFFPNQEMIAPINLSFSVIPLINSVVRCGTDEEKDILFRAMNSIRSEETWTLTKKKKNKVTGKFDPYEVTLNLYEYALDVCKKVKGRQAAMVKKVMADAMAKIDNSDSIAIHILDLKNEHSVAGLSANKLVGKYQKPVLILSKKEDSFMGSARGHEKTIKNLKKWCQDTGLVEYAQGHDNAFGIGIHKDKLEDFKLKIKEIQKSESVYEVDVIFDGKVNKDIIYDIEESKYLFGGKVHAPLLAFTNININKSFIRQRGTVLTFYDNGVEFIMYNTPEGLYEDMTYNFERYIKCDFVGTATVNNFNGKETAQIVLVDVEKSAPKVEEEVTVDNIVF